MTQRYITNNANETMSVGKELATSLGVCTVAFYGDLGAGKTTFVRGMCEGLGYNGDVSSPTFAIVNEYHGGRLPLYHFDLYRIESFDDLYACGFYDYYDADEGILAIEWSENLAEALPNDAVVVRISYGETDQQRVIEVSREE